MLKKMLLVSAAVMLLGAGCTSPSSTPQPVPTGTVSQGPIQYKDLVKLTSPISGAKISSPLTVKGEARGTWYFEASFPVRVLDAQQNVLGTGIAQAQSDWMTENYVPFIANVTFPSQPAGSKGTLVLQKDNPSGLPEHEDSLIVPIIF